MIRKNLTTNSLKGMLVDIITGVATPGVFSFCDYTIAIKKNDEGPAIKEKKLETNQSKRYYNLKQKGLCISCGSHNLATGVYGRKLVVCERCNKIKHRKRY